MFDILLPFVSDNDNEYCTKENKNETGRKILNPPKINQNIDTATKIPLLCTGFKGLIDCLPTSAVSS